MLLVSWLESFDDNDDDRESKSDADSDSVLSESTPGNILVAVARCKSETVNCGSGNFRLGGRGGNFRFGGRGGKHSGKRGISSLTVVVVREEVAELCRSNSD